MNLMKLLEGFSDRWDLRSMLTACNSVRLIGTIREHFRMMTLKMGMDVIGTVDCVGALEMRDCIFLVILMAIWSESS